MLALDLLAVSVVPFFTGLTGVAYLAGAVVCGAAMLVASVRFFFDRGRNARSLFMISNLYLLTVMLLLVVDARG